MMMIMLMKAMMVMTMVMMMMMMLLTCSVEQQQQALDQQWCLSANLVGVNIVGYQDLPEHYDEYFD